MAFIVVDVASLRKKGGVWSHLKFLLSNAMFAPSKPLRRDLKSGVFFVALGGIL
ncbi:hypothetical protein HC956_10325 [Alcaligenes faecalis]|uniref:Uncharacterized protein n=1 Tax=Alcaligenes ammonioxydans TaxID=2582914 RepID=A0ABX8SUL7_9BURK|nr:hypothetical protein [Alcaligenes ammonioxydans]QXX79379.1 hypothetical protein FE795_10340 [Alcaligenes ammonioxydans]